MSDCKHDKRLAAAAPFEWWGQDCHVCRIKELERINQQLLVAANHHADNAKELQARLDAVAQAIQDHDDNKHDEQDAYDKICEIMQPALEQK